jgi:hypothetical protein
VTLPLAGAARGSPSLVRIYVFGVGVLLLVQGGLSLLVRATGRDPHETTRLLSDPWHGAIHVVWGVLLLAILARSRDPAVVEWAAVAFGVFYLGFLALGLLVHHPLGLMIDGPENVFHAVVGGLSLILGLRALAHRRERAG